MEFKIIPGYENYGIDKSGNVIVFKRSQWSREKKRKWNLINGRALVALSKNGKKTALQISRLVAEVFIPNPDKLPCVLHLDDNPLNNHISNLKWGTHQENMDLSWIPEKGRQAPNKKLLYQIKDGTLVRTFKSGHEANKYGFNNRSISQVCLGKRKSHRGFQWSYNYAN